MQEDRCTTGRIIIYTFRVCKGGTQKRDGYREIQKWSMEYGVYARCFAVRIFKDT